MNNVHPIKPDTDDPSGAKHVRANNIAGFVVLGLAALFVIGVIILPLAIFLTRLASGDL